MKRFVLGLLLGFLAFLAARSALDTESTTSSSPAPVQALTPGSLRGAPSPTRTPTSTATPLPTPTPGPPERLALAIYVAWYDTRTWQTDVASDLPEPLFNSDDPLTIRRDVALASQTGLDGFVSFWIAPGDRTDRNFGRLLRASEGTSFRSAIGFLGNVAQSPSMDGVVQALAYIRDSHARHPNYLRHVGKPVLFFTDMSRMPGTEARPAVEVWRGVRDQVDPDRSMMWVAEGLDPSYLSVFDGLYVLKVTHQDSPNDCLKASRWARQARVYGSEKLWIATIMPGWDDTRTQDVPGGFRVPSPPHRRDREEGAFMQMCFDAAIETAPEWLLVHSWNEFVEGTHIHPSQRYGDFYLNLAKQLLSQFRAAVRRVAG